jgi:hypothetical protein
VLRGSLTIQPATTNTANGFQALVSNTTGFNNTAVGVRALTSATTANGNTATGVDALRSDNTGESNTADGQNALFNNTTGSSNIALGFRAGFNLTTGNNNIDIGNLGVAGESSTIRVGLFQTSTFIAGISGVAVTGRPVVVNANGRLGVTASSARFKQAIKPMDKVSEAILALKPVTFRYKKEIDADGTPEFGLVAEDVEKVNPDLVVRDADGKLSACATTRSARCCSTSSSKSTAKSSNSAEISRRLSRNTRNKLMPLVRPYKG